LGCEGPGVPQPEANHAVGAYCEEVAGRVGVTANAIREVYRECLDPVCRSERTEQLPSAFRSFNRRSLAVQFVGVEQCTGQAVFVDENPGATTHRVGGCEVVDPFGRFVGAGRFGGRTTALLVAGEEEVVALPADLP